MDKISISVKYDSVPKAAFYNLKERIYFHSFRSCTMISQARILAVLLSAVVAQSAFASDGTINFTGELLDSTCTVNVNGAVGPAAASVTLPKVSAKQLSTDKATAGQTAFNITLSACAGTSTSAAAYFESGAGVDQVTGYVKNTGAAKQVALQLVDLTSDTVIKAGDIGQTTSTSKIKKNTTGTTPTTVLPYAVQYISTGVATAGTVIGAVTYSITYQ
ncbi:fimbrial protein [Janthinobacterium sp. NKUCC06_STL]|uniref:fimbrial protein n=1 Tax=Janthinobacterium sp. NKUCC06_STL TaxID=2842127 RepID=UPI001C5A9E43|nr:fimbrial protein [Janthinobacterium sp. NKUCC06_STL]MBW3512197.1 type 1 fimbrial protein [Janthinobacterium sp. NKUCC06_STL]